jgi:hypothetical protein
MYNSYGREKNCPINNYDECVIKEWNQVKSSTKSAECYQVVTEITFYITQEQQNGNSVDKKIRARTHHLWNSSKWYNWK